VDTYKYQPVSNFQIFRREDPGKQESRLTIRAFARDAYQPHGDSLQTPAARQIPVYAAYSLHNLCFLEVLAQAGRFD
jgi:hypothetical protein